MSYVLMIKRKLDERRMILEGSFFFYAYYTSFLKIYVQILLLGALYESREARRQEETS